MPGSGSLQVTHLYDIIMNAQGTASLRFPQVNKDSRESNQNYKYYKEKISNTSHTDLNVS